MSVLGQAVRTYLAAQTGYSTYLPGGISPDQTGQGNTSQPYAVYQSMSRQRQRLTSGVVAATTERVQVTVVGETRSSAQASANWIASKITSTPSRQTVGSLFIHHWRIEDEVSANEVYQDGSDESARIISVEIVGTYTE
jgi:hypothetical protein